MKKAENGSGIDHYTRVPGTGAKQKITFTKMHGCANDYVYIDCFQNDIQNYAELAIYLSDRHTGIGGDGVVLICPSDKADARMRMFNQDGSEGKMCGNAIRCVAKYLYDNGIVPRDDLTIEAGGLVHRLHLYTRFGTVGLVTVDMGKPAFEPSNVPVTLPGERVIDRPVTIAGGEYRITCLSMGNPHCPAQRCCSLDRRRYWRRQAGLCHLRGNRFRPDGRLSESGSENRQYEAD